MFSTIATIEKFNGRYCFAKMEKVYDGGGGVLVDADYKVYLDRFSENVVLETIAADENVSGQYCSTEDDGDDDDDDNDDGVVVDADYKLFLELLGKNNYKLLATSAIDEKFNRHSCCTKEEEDDGDSVFEDPQYKMFSEHLRPQGKSYALVIPEDNIYIKYNDESESSSCATKNANHALDEANVGLVKDQVHAKYKGNQGRGPKTKSSRIPAVMNFNGGSYVVAIEAQNLGGNNGVNRHRVRPRMHAVKNSNGGSYLVASEAQNHGGNNCVKRRRGRPRKDAVKNSNGSGNLVALEAQNHGGNNGSKRRRGNPRKHDVNGKGRVQIVDHGTKCGHTDTPSGIASTTKVKVETEDYHDKATLKKRPIQGSDLNLAYCVRDNQANARKLTEYRENLMKELERPYCDKEYVRLLKEITVKKPVQHHKELRGGRFKMYEEGYLGKSLLEHHVELSRKIDAVCHDRPRVLNLLRGFFYWLKNLSNEDSFMPWTDSRLNVLPQQ